MCCNYYIIKTLIFTYRDIEIDNNLYIDRVNNYDDDDDDDDDDYENCNNICENNDFFNKIEKSKIIFENNEWTEHSYEKKYNTEFIQNIFKKKGVPLPSKIIKIYKVYYAITRK